jgi:hypothetical protein
MPVFAETDMGLATILGHVSRTAKDLNYRSIDNLTNQGVALAELAAACRARGWRCMQSTDGIYIAKTDAALTEFKVRNPEGSYNEL